MSPLHSTQSTNKFIFTLLKCQMYSMSWKQFLKRSLVVYVKKILSANTVETAYSDQPLIWIRKFGIQSFLYKCCLNYSLIVVK